MGIETVGTALAIGIIGAAAGGVAGGAIASQIPEVPTPAPPPPPPPPPEPPQETPEETTQADRARNRRGRQSTIVAPPLLSEAPARRRTLLGS